MKLELGTGIKAQLLYKNAVPLEEWPASIGHQIIEAKEVGADSYLFSDDNLPTAGCTDRSPLVDQTYDKITNAITHPNGGTPITPIFVQPGYYFYWRTTAGTWRVGAGHPNHGPEGRSDVPANSRFYCPGDFSFLGQMVSKTHVENNVQVWAPYLTVVDRSQGGTKIYHNETSHDWVLHWYINDDLRYYEDNYGIINHTIVVRRYA